eukprot:6697493-Prymnesium_polylepis.1
MSMWKLELCGLCMCEANLVSCLNHRTAHPHAYAKPSRLGNARSDAHGHQQTSPPPRTAISNPNPTATSPWEFLRRGQILSC